MRRLLVIIALLSIWPCTAIGRTNSGIVRQITIHAPRDLGFFAGDLVKATVDIEVEDGYVIDAASLPRPGPVNYWLDLRSIGLSTRKLDGGASRISLQLVYQNFYDSLDTRPQEIPTFAITFVKNGARVEAFVPAWTIEVSSLREVAPPVKTDPKDYLRPDDPAPFVETDGHWQLVGLAAAGLCLSLVAVAFHRAVWPFHARKTRAFAEAARHLRRLSSLSDTDARYLDAMLLLHRGIDRTDGRRVLADDLDGFLDRHPAFASKADGLARFFAASRIAFFGSDPTRSRATMPYRAIERLAAKLAADERALS